jgi:hypothetical protein
MIMAVNKKDRDDTFNTAQKKGYEWNSDGTKLTRGTSEIKLSDSGGSIIHDGKSYHRGADVRNNLNGK